MLRGFATINYWTDDLEAAKGWYAELLGVDPFGNVLGIMYNPHYVQMLRG